MDQENETKRRAPDASDIERPVSERPVSKQIEQRPGGEPADEAKPDEGIRPGDLTTENDGGSEG